MAENFVKKLNWIPGIWIKSHCQNKKTALHCAAPQKWQREKCRAVIDVHVESGRTNPLVRDRYAWKAWASQSLVGARRRCMHARDGEKRRLARE
jgi:hypothetical protein